MSEAMVTPFLWFDDHAEEAATFYVDVFSKRGKPAKKGDPSGTGVTFELAGQRAIAFNGGPMFKFNEAFSFSVACDTQEEIDSFWDALVDGGKPGRCGWLKDKFGLSWQIVPRHLKHLLRSPAAMAALMTMTKLDIAALEKANETAL